MDGWGALLGPAMTTTTGPTPAVVAPPVAPDDEAWAEEARAEVWPRLVAVWPLYDAYEDRAGRGLRVFHLTPVAKG
jgi:hypothetical protein